MFETTSYHKGLFEIQQALPSHKTRHVYPTPNSSQPHESNLGTLNMFDRNPTPSPLSLDEDDRFDKIINQAPRPKSSAALKPKVAAKKRIGSAATKAATAAPATRKLSTRSPAPTKRSTPASSKQQRLSKSIPTQGQNATDEEKEDTRTQRSKSRKMSHAQLRVNERVQNKLKPIVPDDEEEDTVDALAVDQSSDEEDDQCNLPKLTATSDARASATVSTARYSSAPKGPVGEWSRSDLRAPQATSKRATVSRAPFKHPFNVQVLIANRKRRITPPGFHLVAIRACRMQCARPF
jgi:hypothetical protein